MDNFLITLGTVLLMFAYALPGFLIVKTKLISENSISAFAVVLMYVCQPCLTIYSFDQADFTPDLLVKMLIFFAIVFVAMIIFLVVFYFIFKNKFDNIMNRLYIICTCFGNVAFFGNPLMEAILPDNNNIYIFSTMFFIAMNIIGWTVGCYLITQDKKHISPKKIFLNPAVLSLVVAVPLFLCKVHLVDIGGVGSTLGNKISTYVTLLAKMTTPICMLIMGMRLATVDFKSMFTNLNHYPIIFVKHVIFPFFILLIVYFLPIESYIKQILFILAACPCAVIVQTFAEMLNQGQKESVQMVLLSTMISVITLPLLMLIPLF